MANEKSIYTESFIAGEDLTSGQYLAVTLVQGSNMTVDQHDAATDVPSGVQLNDPDDGEEVLVCVIGRCPVVAGEALKVHDLIRFGANARAYIFEPDTDTTAYCAGQVTKAAGAAAQMGEAMINCVNPWRGEE